VSPPAGNEQGCKDNYIYKSFWLSAPPILQTVQEEEVADQISI